MSLHSDARSEENRPKANCVGDEGLIAVAKCSPDLQELVLSIDNLANFDIIALLLLICFPLLLQNCRYLFVKVHDLVKIFVIILSNK